MNKISKSAIVLSSLLALTSHNINAAEENAGIIHFTGEIIEPSCEIEGDSGTDSTIPLGTYTTSLFKAPGDESDLVPFLIRLADCPVGSDGLTNVQLTFTGPTTLTDSTSLLDVSAIKTAGATAATGVGIAVTPKLENTRYLTFDGAEGQVYVELPSVVGNDVKAEFNARYKSFSSTVTAGPADADMTVNIVYR
ncbi:fimbrial protein [Pseudescherichia vulneris]